MKEQQREEKGGKRIKKKNDSSRQGIRLTFVLCCCLAIVLLLVWQSGVLPELLSQKKQPVQSSVIAEESTIEPLEKREQQKEEQKQVQVEHNKKTEHKTEKDKKVSEEKEPTEEKTPWNLVLVNKWNVLPEGYQIETVELSNGQVVDKRIYPSLQKMFDDARAAGVYPIVASGYRTKEKQQSLMDEKIAAYEAEGYTPENAKAEAEKWVAIPGTSEHQLGLAVDINADGINSAGYEVYDWLDVHACEYGFIHRYPEDKTEITGISNEPWHYRYVGVKVAKEIQSRGLCLEEYLNKEK